MLFKSAPMRSPYAKDAEPAEAGWVPVTERLPDDGELVHVMVGDSRSVRVARRGHYQNTGAWFDAETQQPIYEMIARWKPRAEIAK